MGAMTRGIPYRKYRPYQTRNFFLVKIHFFYLIELHFIAIKGNAKVWWKFAFNCIVETEIKRRKKNWSWQHIQYHRTQCRNYAEVK